MDKLNGGQVMAIRQRRAAEEKYNSAPNFCLQCAAKIDLIPGVSPAAIRKKKFCDKSCAARHNNAVTPKRQPSTSKTGNCKFCDAKIVFKRRISGGFSRRKLCDACNAMARRKGAECLHMRLKGELYASRKNWQSASSSVRKHARTIYMANNGQRWCFVCSYSNHYEVCHLKPVSEFADSATVGEINRFENLIALCPNHHWDLDHGLLDLQQHQT